MYVYMYVIDNRFLNAAITEPAAQLTWIEFFSGARGYHLPPSRVAPALHFGMIAGDFPALVLLLVGEAIRKQLLVAVVAIGRFLQISGRYEPDR